MANYGLKISQPDQDVKTCPDDKLMWTSKFSSLKVKRQGSSSVTIPANQNSAKKTISHNLGYKPAFLVFIQDTRYGERFLCHYHHLHLPNPTATYSWSRINDIQIYVYRNSEDPDFAQPRTLTFYYYIFYEKAE